MQDKSVIWIQRPAKAEVRVDPEILALVQVWAHGSHEGADVVEPFKFTPEWLLLIKYGVPLTLLFTYTVEITTYLMTYWYNGLSWATCWEVVFSERRIGIYVDNFAAKVVSKLPWLADFINEGI